MKVGITISVTKEELLQLLNEHTGTNELGHNKISMIDVYKGITDKDTKMAFLADVQLIDKDGIERLKSIFKPLESIKDSETVVAIFEADIDEQEDILFERDALPQYINNMSYSDFVNKIQSKRIYNCANYNVLCCRMIATNLTVDNLLGIIPICC